MTGALTEIAGVRAYVCDAEGPPIASERDAADIIGETLGLEARLVVIPLARLPPAFLDLKTRLAGELLQKFVNYHRQVAIVGDVAATAAGSTALRDFIGESNRGRNVWFLPDMAALAAKLAQAC
jgi:hypothetical protein